MLGKKLIESLKWLPKIDKTNRNKPPKKFIQSGSDCASFTGAAFRVKWDKDVSQSI